MARFTIVNNHLYAVSNSALNVVSIVNGADPVFTNKVQMTWGIETLYPFNNRLFIGSTTGMFIFDIANPTNPVQLGTFSHARKCDPVIADNTNAFVTLRTGIHARAPVSNLMCWIFPTYQTQRLLKLTQ